MSHVRRDFYLALSREHAAASCGVLEDAFDQHIRPYVGCLYLGSMRRWPVFELERWLVGVGRWAPHQPLRLNLGRQQAAAAFDMGVDSFDRHVRPNVRRRHIGSKPTWPVFDLERWLAEAVTPGVVSTLQQKRPRAADTAGGMAHGGRTP